MRAGDPILIPVLFLCSILALLLPVEYAIIPAASAALFIICISNVSGPPRKVPMLRLRGGHKDGCACGEIGDVTDRWLFDVVDMDRIACFNTEQGHGVAAVLRAHCEKDDPTKWLESSDDDQVLMCIAFAEHVNLKSLTLLAGGPTAPLVVKVFVNKAIDDFEEAENAEADGVWEMTEGEWKGEALKTPDDRRFINVREITVFVERSVGGDRTCIQWLGLQGEATRVPIKGVVQDTEYELRPSDVHLRGMTQGPRHTTGF